MGVTETTTRIYVCDRCGKTREDTRFPMNGKVLLTHDLHDFQGAAVAGRRIELELCDECLDAVVQCINAVPPPPEE